MKKYNFFSYIILLLLLSECAVDKKNLFSFDESKFKLVHTTNDVVGLVLKNEKNKTIDSVAYFSNNKKIGAVREIHHWNLI